MGQNQLLLALIFTAALSGGLGYFAGLVNGYGKGIIDMSQKTNKDLEK